MKKIISTGFLILISYVLHAQSVSDTSKHLSFKGIPLDGTLEQFVLKMKKNGFEHIATNDGIAMLQGDFAGSKNCIIGVSTLKQKDLVHKINVMFSEKTTWSTLSGNYFEFKQLLIEKYGNPNDVVEKFDTKYETRDDLKIYDVKSDRCKYYSTWETDKGKIELSIDHDKLGVCFVRLVYIDKINSLTIKKQAIDDL